MMRATTALALALLGCPITARAQGGRWESQVRARLERTIAALAAPGEGRRRVIRVGPLNNEETESFVIELKAGARYDIAGACDEDCSDLHLLLSTPTGSDVAIDRSSESLPVLRFSPRASGAYRMKVTMAACRLSPCWYGVAVRGP